MQGEIQSIGRTEYNQSFQRTIPNISWTPITNNTESNDKESKEKEGVGALLNLNR